MPEPTEPRSTRTSPIVAVIRYGIGGVMVAAGIVILILNPGGFGVDGFGLAVGGGGSVLLINWLYRLGVEGDRERDAEEQARRYFDEHGRWPGDPPPRPRAPRRRAGPPPR